MNPTAELQANKSSRPEMASSSITHETMDLISCSQDSKTQIEACNSASSCSHLSLLPHSRMDVSLTEEESYPPLPPMRIGATSVSCVVCDTVNENIRTAAVTVDGERSFSPLLPTSHPDWNVRKWQTRQIANAFMDNTINSVMEEMGFTPFPDLASESDPDDVFGTINFPRVDDDYIEEDEEDESIENEGILSAIQRHGLQRHTIQSPSVVQANQRWGPRLQLLYQCNSHPKKTLHGRDPLVKGETSANSEQDNASSSSESDSDDNFKEWTEHAATSSCHCKYPSTCKEVTENKRGAPQSYSFRRRSHSIDDEMGCRESVEFDRSPSSLRKEIVDKTIDLDEDGSKRRQGRENNSSFFSKRRCVESVGQGSKCSSSSSLPSQIRMPNLHGDIMSISSHSNDSFGHFEFMDAAVAAAIQKKGLSALGCQDL